MAEVPDLVRIPSVSACAAHVADVVTAGESVVARLKDAGIEPALVNYVRVAEMRTDEPEVDLLCASLRTTTG